MPAAAPSRTAPCPATTDTHGPRQAPDKKRVPAPSLRTALSGEPALTSLERGTKHCEQTDAEAGVVLAAA